jgi:2-oxoglutarate ferredoxin oxidoreductase subunit alpha
MSVTIPPAEPPHQTRKPAPEELETVTIRFAGDSGDGMQLAGTRFTDASAILGNDISTLPDFPAEIRAPAGTLPGVSGFQVHFSSRDIHTPGDTLNALVAMNPAALKTNLKDLQPGGILLVNADAFTSGDLHKAGYKVNPLEDNSLRGYRLIRVPMNKLNRDAVAEVKLSPREADRCKNFFALGLVYWLYERPLDPTLRWIKDKFKKNPAVLEANTRTLKAGYNYGETTETLPVQYRVPKAQLKPGRYRKITGNEALALGLVAATQLANLPLLYASYPITPASDILHHLSDLKRYGVRTVQAEDEIAAIGVAIGSSFAGTLGVTATSPSSSLTCSAEDPAPACRPRPNRPTCCKPCSAATANAPPPSWHLARLRIVSTWSLRRYAWRSATCARSSCSRTAIWPTARSRG